MGIEHQTKPVESVERNERDIQAELIVVDAQIESTPNRKKIDSLYMQDVVRKIMESRTGEKQTEVSVSDEEANALQTYNALLEKKSKLKEERREFYRNNPEALKLRVREIYKDNFRKFLNANPEAMDEFVHGRRLKYHPDPNDLNKVEYISNTREAFNVDDWFVRVSEDSNEYDEYNELSHLLPNEHEREDFSSERNKAQFDFLYNEPIQELHDELTSKASIEATPVQSLQERVSPKTAEFMIRHILDKDLAYQDAELPEEHKEQMLAWSRSSESAKRYAESVAGAATVGGIENVRNMARQIRDIMLVEAERLGIPVSPQGKSLSWAMWDMGKQHHFFTHQDENDSRYEIGNPIESEAKRDEILNRHLGWEAYAAFQSDRAFRERVSNNAAALVFFNKSPKSNGTLSSKDLADLGKALRNQ